MMNSDSAENKVSRRDALTGLAAGVIGAVGLSGGTARADDEKKAPAAGKGNINQSVCRWCYGKIPLEKLAEDAKKFGYKSVELLKPEEYLKVKALGLTCAMLQGTGTIDSCFNQTENHERCVADLRKAIDFAAEHGLPNVICFSGNRKGMADDVGMDNCAVGLKAIVPYAEQKKVTICMELLNSKVNHKDYMCDHTAWGVGLCKKVASPNFKLLYDIYHMQIMEGFVIQTIRENKDYIGHYHTGGVPGRNEIDETQELYYPAIMKAIVETGYKGYVGQEFIPKRDPMASLEAAFKVCDV